MKRNVPIGFRQGEHNDNLKCYIDFKLQGVVVVAFKVVVLHVHVWERLCGFREAPFSAQLQIPL